MDAIECGYADHSCLVDDLGLHQIFGIGKILCLLETEMEEELLCRAIEKGLADDLFPPRQPNQPSIEERAGDR